MIEDSRCKALKLFVPGLKKEIEKHKEVIISDIGLAVRMGPEGIVSKFHGTPKIRNSISNFWAAKKCLWDDGIVVNRHKGEKSVVRLRARTSEDKGIVNLGPNIE